jgi:RNA polymerase sigma factor (sigma-70 family)
MHKEQASLAAIEAVYRSRGAEFFRLAVARTGSAEAARDAVQDGFARAIRGRASFRGDGPLEAWIARCVINAARDAAAADPAAYDTGTADLASNGVTASSHDSSAIVREAVQQLPQRQRDALFLRFYLDFDYAAIADALGVEVGTVSATLHAARSALARTLEEASK